MARLILKMAITLDGLAAGPNGEVSWMSAFADEEEQRWDVATLWDAQAHLMGSRTFLDMKAYWPVSSGPVADAMNAIPKIAFSRRGLEHATTTTALQEALDSPDARSGKSSRHPGTANWATSEVLSGDLAEELAMLKQREGKPLLVHGGAGFARSLLALDCVDELRLTIHPIVLGHGLRIFDGSAAWRKFKLVTSVRFGSGLAGLVLVPQGKFS
jgi:dihydrofolate reductase